MLIDTKRKPTPLPILIAIELVVTVLVASLPMFIGFHAGGADALNQIVSSLIPVTQLLWWSVGLTVVALCVDYLNRVIYKRSEVGARIWDWLSIIADEVAPSIQSILRIIGGVMITFVLLWWIYELETLEPDTARYFLLIGAAGFAEAVAIRYFVERLAITYSRKERVR